MESCKLPLGPRGFRGSERATPPAPRARAPLSRVRKKAAAVAAAPSSALQMLTVDQHRLPQKHRSRLRLHGSSWYSLGSPIVPLSPPPCPHSQMKGEAATRTRCSAARWLRSLVLALSKCLVAAAPVATKKEMKGWDDNDACLEARPSQCAGRL